MSKSKGEFLTVSLLEEKGYNPLAYRLLCLQSHFKKQLVFTYESLEQTENTYNKLINRIKNLNSANLVVNKENIDKYQNSFKEALENNLNTSNALTVLYDVLKSDLNDAEKLFLVKDFDQVLSLNLTGNELEIDSDLKEYIDNKIEERKQAKINKDYDLADQIRKELEEKGIIIKDTREGTTYEIIK